MGSRKKALVSLTKIPVRFHGNLTKFRRNRLLFSRKKKKQHQKGMDFLGDEKRNFCWFLEELTEISA